MNKLKLKLKFKFEMKLKCVNVFNKVMAKPELKH